MHTVINFTVFSKISSPPHLTGKLIVSRYIAESITITFCRQLTRPMWPNRPASAVIDSATYLFTINLPDIDNVAMSLYNITTYNFVNSKLFYYVLCLKGKLPGRLVH